jgi:hypothetical protein
MITLSECLKYPGNFTGVHANARHGDLYNMLTARLIAARLSFATNSV